MMHAVPDNHVPENLANGNGPRKKWNLAVEVRRAELLNACYSFLMNALVAGREFFHFARALNVRRFHVHGEAAFFYAVAHVRIAFSQMPGQLAERTACAIGTKIVLRCGQSAQKL